MSLKDFFAKNIETRDNHPNSEFRSHYYKCDYREAKATLLRYFKQKGYKVSNVNDNYHEIFVETSRFHLIISIKPAGGLSVSVDIKVVVYGLIGAYKPRNLVRDLYKYLDKEIMFLKIG